MRIKAGVRVHGLRPEILLALMVAESVYRRREAELVLTCGIDGQHSRGSKHYIGNAIDLRLHNLPPGTWQEVREEIAGALGIDYDVVLEDDHIHIEFDPKIAYAP